MKLRRARTASVAGFTLLELLVALAMTSVIMALIINSLLQLRNTYFADIKRVQMNGNLRSAMDIISMNIRQAGENLLAAYPAVILSNGASGASDTLQLRRSPITEVLTLCAAAANAATTVYVSSASLSNTECVPANVAPVFTIFTNEVNQMEGTKRVFVLDKTTKTGEFVNYSGSGQSSGQYYLTIGNLSRAYTEINTSIYVIEEYQFSHNAAENRLELTINQDGTARPVAFDVSNFQVTFNMEDASTVSAFNQQSGTLDWKDIRAIDLTLTGRGTFKDQVITSTIESRYFPRNVLSYEGG